MDKDEILKKMCSSDLSQADIKAICKARDLPPGCPDSRELFRHNFLTHRGIEKVMASLDEKQVLFLHLLNATKGETDIRFFERLYKASNTGGFWGSFNDKYKGVFKSVKTNLVRKGLLLMAEAPKDPGDKTTVLERQRFMFPSEFSSFLPLFVNPVTIEGPGLKISGKDVIRDKLREIPGQPGSRKALSVSKSDRLHVRDGNLLHGNNPFTVKGIKDRLRSGWGDSFGIDLKRDNVRLSPVDLICYSLSGMKEGDWAQPEDILPLWEMAYPEVENLPDIRKVCEKGLDQGCLEKTTRDGKTYFRLREMDKGSENLLPEDFLSVKNDEFIEIDLSSIPFDMLEWLSSMCYMKPNKGSLAARPDLVKISHAPEKITESPTFLWLQEHHKAFGDTVRTIKSRKGKTIVHDNLMIARIRDLSVKVQLEKKFSDKNRVVPLSGEFIAFPVDLFPEIQKVITKSGNAVKLVDSHDKTGV
ncbi:MAG: hypothetical protein PVG39_22000 [Desulfobacteraceae bacterium]|jgi:hypothetical protein